MHTEGQKRCRWTYASGMVLREYLSNLFQKGGCLSEQGGEQEQASR